MNNQNWVYFQDKQNCISIRCCMVRADLIIAGVVREITITENGKQNVNTKIEVWPDARHRKGCGAQTQWLYICIYCRQTIQTSKTISLSKYKFSTFRHGSSTAECFSNLVFVSEILRIYQTERFFHLP